MAKSHEIEHPIKAFGWAARDTSGVLSPSTSREGVGVLIGSCRKCDSCTNDLEQYCPSHIGTYSTTYYDGTTTYGGYSDFMLDKPGLNIGVVGLGGLGHMAVKFAKAFGCNVTVISTSINKKDEAIKHLGANSFLISHDQEQMQFFIEIMYMSSDHKSSDMFAYIETVCATSTLDGIIDTVSAEHPIAPLLNILKPRGKLVMVGLPPKPLELPAWPLLMGRKIMGGSIIGGMKETQEMLDFAAKHNITPQVEVVSLDYVNIAVERLLKSNIKYRFVLDIGKTSKAGCKLI
ncbi:hypothetical protein H5410_054647 [Solanum commersonii]|uniref:Alcohol dehydrogenase-like C-terminal domain-containing protein n=1 Tax=Solanum commersonii TaxID=4109 RepID=A0A9J5WFI2_SOLCO|nr:hypothetical protein H5410_054647 [Solanum commersonii]